MPKFTKNIELRACNVCGIEYAERGYKVIWVPDSPLAKKPIFSMLRQAMQWPVSNVGYPIEDGTFCSDRCAKEFIYGFRVTPV